MRDDRTAALDAAAQPTVERLADLAANASPVSRSILLEVSERFLEPGFTVGKLKEALKVNDRHLARFTQEVGITASELIQECRMETAIRLLPGAPYAVEDTAYLMGYESVRAFEKLCLRWCDLSPGQLRERLRDRRAELGELPADAFTWSFDERFHRGELTAAELLGLFEVLTLLYHKS